MLCSPNYADESGCMVVCEDCDFAGESFVLGEQSEGLDRAVESWNAEPSQAWKQSPDYKAAAERLEQDMRRYIYDKTPERRIKCLDQYRERLELGPWGEADLKNALKDFKS